jgi:hypothetical protein
VERDSRAIALLPNLQIVEQPPNIGEQQIANLGLLVERRLDLGKGSFQVPVSIGKGKRGPDLFETRSILPLS